MSDGRDDTQARPAGGVRPSPDLLQKWSRAPYWGPEEGVALAFGLDPSRVVEARQNDRPRLKAADPAPHFARLARRAVSKGDLEEEARPAAFLDWAKGVGLGFNGIWTLILNPRIWMSKPNPRIPAGPDGTLETVGETMKPVSEFIERRDELIRNWALAPTWTLREGACLANNVSPRLLSEHGFFPRRHPAAERVNQLIEFARRSMHQFKLSTDPTPAVFIAWSENVGFPFDAKWIEVIGNPCIPAESKIDDSKGNLAGTQPSERVEAEPKRGRKRSMDKVVAWFYENYPGGDRRDDKWRDVARKASKDFKRTIDFDSMRNAVSNRKKRK